MFKGYNDFMKWIQYRGTFSNMNIFSTMMSVEDMVKRTSDPETDCASPGDYLRFEEIIEQPVFLTIM